VRDQIATNATNHRRRADAAEPSLLVGVLVDARGERFTPSHAVKKGRRYRYYVSAALITQAGADHAQGWRLPAQEIEDAVIRVLTDALTSPAMLLERFGTAGIPSDQTGKCSIMQPVSRRPSIARQRNEPKLFETSSRSRDRRECNHDQDPPLCTIGRSSRATLIREPERQPNRACSAYGLQAPRCRNQAGAAGSGDPERSLAMRPHADQGDRARTSVVRGACRGTRPIAAGIGRARWYHAPLCPAPRRPRLSQPELVDAILHGRQPVELTATRLTELDLPLDWTDQRSLLASR